MRRTKIKSQESEKKTGRLLLSSKKASDILLLPPSNFLLHLIYQSIILLLIELIERWLRSLFFFFFVLEQVDFANQRKRRDKKNPSQYTQSDFLPTPHSLSCTAFKPKTFNTDCNKVDVTYCLIHTKCNYQPLSSPL